MKIQKKEQEKKGGRIEVIKKNWKGKNGEGVICVLSCDGGCP